MDAMLLVKATLLLSSALIAARLLRRAPAETRHRLWTFAFGAVLTLPLLAFALPPLRVGVLVLGPPEGGPHVRESLRGGHHDRAGLLKGSETAPDAASDSPAVKSEMPADVGSGFSRTYNARSVWSRVRVWLLRCWLLGTSAAALALLLSVVRALRLAANAEEVRDPAWDAAAVDLAARLGLHRSARLVVSRHVATPMAGGIWRPVIFLPTSARAWTAEQRDVVLAHEIAHLAGGDPLRHLTARLAVALYWFHPLAWIAARLATVAREQACDEAVLTLGTRPSLYARVLLDLSKSMARPPRSLAVLAMVERSLLETRLMAILNDDKRPDERRRPVMLAILAAVLTLAVAAAQPAARVSAPPVAQPPAALIAPASPEPVRSQEPAPSRPAAPRPGTAAVPAAIVQIEVGDSACWWDYNTVGTGGVDRVVQHTFGDLRVCMLAEDVGDRGASDRPSQWPGRARRVVMETRRGGAVQRLEVGRQGGGPQTSWRVNGASRPFDASAERWRDRLLATLDATWDLSMLRGEVSSLRGQISSIRGQQSSIRGEISSLNGHVRSLRGRISSVRGEESSLRGQISSIRGHVSSLRGEISSERGAISSLIGTRYRATDEDIRQINERIGRHETAINRIEQELRDYNADARIAEVEREIRSLDTDGKINAIEAEIRAFDLDGKVAAAERRSDGLDVDGKIAAIERQIANLDADRRGRELEDRRDAALKELEAAIAAIR